MNKKNSYDCWIIKNDTTKLTNTELTNIQLLSNVLLERGLDFAVYEVPFVYEYLIMKGKLPLPKFIIYLADDKMFGNFLSKILDEIVLNNVELEANVLLKDKKAFNTMVSLYNIPHLNTYCVPECNNKAMQITKDSIIDGIYEYLGDNVIVKENAGGINENVYEINGKNAIKEILGKENDKILLQEKNKVKVGEDIVVYMIGDEAISAIHRKNKLGGFRTDLSMQTECEKCEVDMELRRITKLIGHLTSCDIIELNFLYGKNGTYYLNKIKEIDNYDLVDKMCGIKIEEKIIDYGFNLIKNRIKIYEELKNIVKEKV